MVMLAPSLIAASSPSGIAAIGLDPKALLFQIINFAILFWILKRVAYKPILKVLDARRQRIEDSLRTAAAIEERQKQLAEEQATLLRQARAEASEIITKAKTEVTTLLTEADARAKSRTDKMVAEARNQIAGEVTAASAKLRREIGGLVVSATELVLSEKVDAKKDAGLIERAIKQTEVAR